MPKKDLQGFAKFCDETSLHGLTYLNHKMSKVWKTIWILFLSLIFLAGVFVVELNTKKYIESTIVTTIQSTMASLKDVTLPSVYICNNNQVTKTFVQSIGLLDDPEGLELIINHFIKGSKEPQTQAKQRPSGETEIISRVEKVLQKDSKMISFLFASSQNCSDMIVYGKHSLSGYTLTFIPAYETGTDTGDCCVISPHINFVNDETRNIMTNDLDGKIWLDLPKGILSGPDGGLKLLLDAEIFDSTYASFDGFTVAFVDQRDTPVIAQDGFLVMPGTYVLASLDVTIVNTSESVMNRFDTDRRQCYTDDEFLFKYLPRDDGYQYSMKNCLYAAYFEKVFDNCSCIPDSYRSSNEVVNLTPCQDISLHCAQKWLSKMGSSEMSYATNIYNQSKKCHQRCERQSEHPTITTARFPAKETFNREQYYCLALAKISRICYHQIKSQIFERFYADITCPEILNATNLCKDLKVTNLSAIKNSTKLSKFLLKYAEQNFILLKYFIKDPYYTLIIRDESISLISYLGNVGGLLSLCMGLSLISIFEIFYHTFIAIFKKIFKTAKVSKNET